MRIQDAWIASLLLLSACGAGGQGGDDNLPTCDEDDRDETYVAGMAKLGQANYTVTLMDSDPSPPSKGDNTWFIEVTQPDGNTAPNLGVEATAFMVDHGHTTPVKPVITDEGDGMYTIDPVNLFMPGYWEVTINLVDPGAGANNNDDVDLDSVMFKFCIEG